MAAVWIRLRAELRSRRRAWLGLALMAGLLAGPVIATVAAARRTDSAIDRFRAASGSVDVWVGRSDFFGLKLDLARVELPIAAVIDHSIARADAGALRIPLAAHGAFVLFRAEHEASAAVPPSIARHVVAELTLPLERQRLLALVRTLSQRERESGRPMLDQPDSRAP